MPIGPILHLLFFPEKYCWLRQWHSKYWQKLAYKKTRFFFKEQSGNCSLQPQNGSIAHLPFFLFSLSSRLCPSSLSCPFPLCPFFPFFPSFLCPSRQARSCEWIPVYEVSFQLRERMWKGHNWNNGAVVWVMRKAKYYCSRTSNWLHLRCQNFSFQRVLQKGKANLHCWAGCAKQLERSQCAIQLSDKCRCSEACIVAWEYMLARAISINKYYSFRYGGLFVLVLHCCTVVSLWLVVRATSCILSEITWRAWGGVFLLGQSLNGPFVIQTFWIFLRHV